MRFTAASLSIHFIEAQIEYFTRQGILPSRPSNLRCSNESPEYNNTGVTRSHTRLFLCRHNGFKGRYSRRKINTIASDGIVVNVDAVTKLRVVHDCFDADTIVSTADVRVAISIQDFG